MGQFCPIQVSLTESLLSEIAKNQLEFPILDRRAANGMPDYGWARKIVEEVLA